MTQETLESRVARLEKQVNSLIGARTGDDMPAPDAWKQTIGMFRGDPIVQEMIEESRRMRDEERRRAHDTLRPHPA